MDNILTVDNISLSIGEKNILKNVSVNIAEGKRTVILGPNGSGKSTLLKAMAGLLKYQQGAISFAGSDLRQISRRELAKTMAVLPQGSETPADLSVYELVSYGRFPHRSLFGRSNSEDKTAVEWALARTKLEDYRDRLVKNLSGGERQRAWIAMALAQKPQILLLDEPTTYLDIAHQLEVLSTVSELNKTEQLTVVMVLHDINHAIQFADEIILVKDGQIAGQGTPAELIDQQLLEKLFGVKAEAFAMADGAKVFVPYGLVNNRNN